MVIVLNIYEVGTCIFPPKQYLYFCTIGNLVIWISNSSYLIKYIDTILLCVCMFSPV